MVSAVSLIGTAFAVGGSYFAVDSLRDILIAKTINTSYATRIAIASAAAFAGLMVISKDSASKASKQTKDRLGKQLLSAEEDDPNYMVKSDIHKIAESGIKMNVLMDEFPEADLPVWWKSKISVTASQADDLADNLGYVLAEPDAFDAELDDPSDMTCHYCEKDGSQRGGLTTWPSGLAVCEMCFEEMEERDAEGTFTKGQKNDLLYFYLAYKAHETGESVGMIHPDEWNQIALGDGRCYEVNTTGHDNTITRKTLKSLLGKGLVETTRSDTFLDYTEGLNQDPDLAYRIGSVCIRLTPRGVELIKGMYARKEMGAEGTKVRRHSLDRFTKQRKPSMDSFRRRGRRSALRSLLAAEDDTVYMIETEYHHWDNWHNDCISYDSFGPYATEAGAQKALKEMMEDEAERWTQHDDLRDPDTGEPMFTFGLELDEYGNLEIKPSGMSLGDFTQKHTKTEHKGGRAFDGMTYSGVVVAKQMKAADSEEPESVKVILSCAPGDPTYLSLQQFLARVKGIFLPNGQTFTEGVWVRLQQGDQNQGVGYIDNVPANTKYKLGQLIQWDSSFNPPHITILEEPIITVDRDDYYEAESDDDDDDTGLVPDREPSRGAPDLWFAEGNYRQFTPQEALKYLRSGDNTVWLIDYADENYGDDERPHYDYPVEDPEDLETMIADGVFDEDSPSYGTVIANGTSYDLDMWKDEPDGKHPSFVEWNAEYYEAECASCDTTHGFDFMCATCGICLDCDPCTHDSKARGPFTDRDAEESINECGLKGRHCHACRGCGRCKKCTIVDGYSISSGDVYCIDCSKYRQSKESVAVGTKFTCDCGAKCTVDADTEIAYGPGGYDLRCGRNDDCRGDEKVLGAEWDESSRTMWDQSEITDADELVRLGKIFKVGSGTTDSWQEYLDDSGPFVYVTKNTRPWALWQPGSREAVVRFNNRGKIASMLVDDVKQLYEVKPGDYGFDAEVFEAFSLSDRPVSVKFGPGTSGNAKMKATFTDASGDTKTTQFGYKGMSDFTKHKDEGRRDSYLARHGSKGQNQNWKDPTTAGALSRYVLWEKTSLPAAKSAFKKRFNLRAEDLDTEDSYVGYQVSPFITETDRMAAWVYEPVYSDEDAL